MFLFCGSWHSNGWVELTVLMQNRFLELCNEFRNMPKFRSPNQTFISAPSVIFGPPGGHFGFFRRYGVAGVERVPLAEIGCYFEKFLNQSSFLYHTLMPYIIQLLSNTFNICLNLSIICLFISLSMYSSY